jgi:hypothetical protein
VSARRFRPLLVSLAAVAAVLVPYLALGGASYEPTPVADPCAPRDWRDPGGLQDVLEQVALSALDGAACELGVAREDLVLALRSEESLDAFADEQEISREDAEQVVEDALDRALEDAEEAGAVSGFVAALVARALDAVPPWLLLDALEDLGGLF